MYSQICQVCQACLLRNETRYIIYTIANESEQIMIDPSDRRGQMYLSYRGPGEPSSRVAGPRYVRYTRNYI